MYVRKIISLFLLNLFFTIHSFSQFDTLHVLDDNLYQYFEYASENLDDSDFQSKIEDLLENPVNLNSATKSDLLNIPFISSKIANNIIMHRNSEGGIKSIHDLLKIKAIDQDLFLLIKSFLELGSYENKRSKNKSSLFFRTRLITDLQDRAGYVNGKYRGSKYKFYNKLKAKRGNISLGLLIEKDPGEILIADHYTGYISFSPAPFLENFLIGDYNLEFGQGLVLWQSYAYSKGADAVLNPIKRSRDFHPFQSAEENLFFRGIISSMKLNSIDITGFYSMKNLDAKIENNEIINLDLSGYHRTESELLKKDKVERKSFGMKLIYYPLPDIKIGLLNLIDKFNKSFIYKNRNELYGNQFSYTSFSWDISHKKISLSGELSYNGTSFAFIGNTFIGITDRIDVLISYRNYSPSFYNISSNGFGEFGNTKNEIGFYFGIKSTTVFGKFNIYIDLFNTPSHSYKADFPTTGYDFLIKYDKKLSSGSNLTIKYKREKKESNLSTDMRKLIQDISKTNYRIDLKYKIAKNLYSKTRIEYVVYNSRNGYESGFSTFQQIKYIWNRNLSIISKISLFDTDSYDSRIYQFENDLKGLMTNRVLYEEGFRWFILVNYSSSNFLNFSIKYSDTIKPNKTEIGSGNSKIDGNIINQFGIQLDFIL